MLTIVSALVFAGVIIAGAAAGYIVSNYFEEE
jgi:hypothetical protein